MNENKRCLQAAISYATIFGWSVIPVHWPKMQDGVLYCSCGKKSGNGEGECPSAGKHPLTRHGVRDASRDPEVIRSWWEKWPEANVGIVTGAISGLWVLDIDPKNEGDETLREIEGKFGKLPFVPTAITGSRGTHYFFKIPDDMSIVSRANVFPGIDVRGEGGFVVAAPSMHKSGRTYEWDLDRRPDAVKPGPAPTWLLDHMAGRILASTGGPATSTIAKPTTKSGKPAPAPPLPAEIKEGGRDNAMTSFAGSMRRRGASEDAILAALRVENAEKCKPPLADSDLIRIAKSVSKKDPSDPMSGDVEDVPLEDRSTIGEAIMRELPTKSKDDLLKVLEDKQSIAALIAMRRIEPAAFAAGLERLSPKSLRDRFDQVTKSGMRATRAAEKRDVRTVEKEKDKRPEICISEGDLESHIAQAVKFLQDAHKPPAARAVYWRAGRVSRVRTEDGSPVVETMREKAMIEALGEAIHWTAKKTGTDGTPDERDVYPPKEVAAGILERPQSGFPRLSSIYTHPVFVPVEGVPTALMSGYHTATGVLVAMPSGLTWTPAIEPTQEQGRAAVRWMLNEVMCDFPFDGYGEVAAAIALALAPFVRPMIKGNVPMTLIEASAPGSGKGLLADVCMSFATGGAGVSLCSQAEDEEEWQKMITSKLSEGAEFIQVDNATGYIDSASLCAVLSAPRFWTARRMGRNDSVIRVPADALWIMTANNLSLSQDLRRRIIRCRLVPKEEDPYKVERKSFKHVGLRLWIDKHRREMLEAGWCAVSSWAHAGAPQSDAVVMGTFESWSYIMGGMLEFLGVPGFLSNREEFLEAADRDTEPMREFVRLWAYERRDDAMPTDMLLDYAKKAEISLRGNDDASRRRSLSWVLRQNRDRVYRGWKITQEKDSTDGKATWKLVPMNDEANKIINMPRPNLFPDRERDEPAF